MGKKMVQTTLKDFPQFTRIVECFERNGKFVLKIRGSKRDKDS